MTWTTLLTQRPLLRGGAFALTVALLAEPASAGVFSVVPVRIFMSPRDRAVAITLTNEGDTPVALQADVNVWRQKPDGTDEETLSEDLILSPPIIKLAPRARQVVRLARTAPADLSQQLTYRLTVREVPEISAPSQPVLQIPITLALSMPVFITPPNAQRTVACEASRSAGAADALNVACTNSGNAYAQVRELAIQRGGQVAARAEVASYLLPGARKTLGLKADKVLEAGPAELVIGFDDGTRQAFPISLP